MENSSEGIKLQYETLMSEYKELASGKANYRQMQSQLDSLSLAGLGVAISLILVVLDRNPQNIGVILLFPTLFYTIAFTQLRHERLLTVAAIYIDAELRPQIEKILSKLLQNEVHVLGHEGFLANRGWAKGFLFEWFATTSRAMVSLAIAVGIAIIYFYVRFVSLPSFWNSYETWLLIVNILMLVVNLAIAFFIAKTRHMYLNRYYAKDEKRKA